MYSDPPHCVKILCTHIIRIITSITSVNTWELKQVRTSSVSADAQALSTRPSGCCDFIQVTATYWQPPRDTCCSASVWWSRASMNRAWGEQKERPKDSGGHTTLYINLLLQTSFIQIHDSNPQFAYHTVDDTTVGSTQRECLFTLMNIQNWCIFMTSTTALSEQNALIINSVCVKCRRTGGGNHGWCVWNIQKKWKDHFLKYLFKIMNKIDIKLMEW